MTEEKDELFRPGNHGANCPYNGEHEDYEFACDECDYYLVCFPDWRELFC